MEKKDEELILSLVGRDAELRACYEEHVALERQIDGLQHKLHLSSDEEVEKRRLQKLKLAGKDRLMDILARYRQH